MAKIIYGVSGQGFGHSTRSKEILKYLTDQGHQVLVFTYGQALFLLDEEFDIFEVPGLGLVYKNNKLLYWQTIFGGLYRLISQSRDWRKIARRFDDFDPNLVITDFEPLSAWLAKIKKKPLISIDNQHQLTNSRIDLPKRYHYDLLIDKLIVRSMVWRARDYLVTTFFDTPAKKKNTFLFPPIVRREVRDLNPNKGDYILVYQNSDFKHLVKLLKTLDHKFVVFGLNVEKEEGNIVFKNYSSRDWLDYLAGCRAIIGTAGLSLISEALYLKKPYLALPVKKQVEQVINAVHLRRMGLGDYCYRLTKERFDGFIGHLPEFERNLNKQSSGANEEIFGKISEVIKEVGVE